MASQQISVLVVSSSNEDIQLIQNLLEDVKELDFHLTCVQNLKEALESLKTWKGDVILADIALSDAKGLNIFVTLREEAPAIPIVLLSSHEDKEQSLEAVRDGAQDYLVKDRLNSSMLSRVLRDAVERRRNQAAVYEAEAKYRTIFENSAVAITLVDPNEKIVSWNSYTEEMLGMHREDLFGRNIKTLYPEKEWDKIREMSIRKKGMRHHFETKIFHKTGDVLDVDISISVLRDANDEVKGSIGIMQDITERKRLEHIKDEFLSTVSHEMRTPMTIIREGVSQVQEGILGSVNDEQREVLNMTLESVDRLSRIINELLDISKLEAGKMEINKVAFDMVALSKKIKQNFNTLAKEKGLQLEVEASQKEVMIEADKDRMIQVLTNLVGNALKFTEKGSIKIFCKEDASFYIFGVQDTGKGLAEEEVSKIFDKFQQFGREHGPGDRGTGLGLSICKKIIELHDGQIWAESELGRGTTVLFQIPKK